MKADTLVIIAVLASTAFWAAPILPVSGQSGPPSQLQIMMGFGPQELVPVQDMVPVYVIGDQVWLSLGHNQSAAVTINSPNGARVATFPRVEPGAVFLAHTLTPTDMTGRWVLVVDLNGTQRVTVPFFVVPPEGVNPPAAPRLVSSAIAANASLALKFGTVTNNAYDMQACLLGSAAAEFAKILLPAIVGNYTLELAGGNTNLTGRFVPLPSGGQPPPFEMWVELRYPYSFSSPLNPNQQTTGDEPVASTTPVLFSSITTGNFSIPLNQFVHLREGRYAVFIYFRNVKGLFLEQASVVRLSQGSWIWLGACSRLMPVGPSFTATVPLNTPLGSWPTNVLIAYRNNGTEGYASAPVTTNLTSVAFSVAPWGGRLPSGYTLGVSPNSNVSSSRSVNGTLYILLNKVPADFVVNVIFQGQAIHSSGFSVSEKYKALSSTVTLGKLQVAVQLDSEPANGATVKVSEAGAPVYTGVTGVAGTVTFLLPAGTYSVVSTLGNSSLGNTVQVSLGQESTLLFPFASSENYTFDYALVVIAVAGILANLWVWLRLPRRSA